MRRVSCLGLVELSEDVWGHAIVRRRGTGESAPLEGGPWRFGLRASTVILLGPDGFSRELPFDLVLEEASDGQWIVFDTASGIRTPWEHCHRITPVYLHIPEGVHKLSIKAYSLDLHCVGCQVWWELRDFQRCLGGDGYVASCKFVLDQWKRWLTALKKLGLPEALCLRKAKSHSAPIDSRRLLREHTASSVGLLVVALCEACAARGALKCAAALRFVRSFLEEFAGADFESDLYMDSDVEATACFASSGRRRVDFICDGCQVLLAPWLAEACPETKAIAAMLKNAKHTAGTIHIADILMLSFKSKVYWLLRRPASGGAIAKCFGL